MATRPNQIGDISKLAVTIAEQAAKSTSADHDPQVVQAIEQVLGLLEQRATPGTELAGVIQASRAAIDTLPTVQVDGAKRTGL